MTTSEADTVGVRRTQTDIAEAGPAVGARIDLLDVARGGALAAMAIYHFFWDLEFFALADVGVTEHPAWIVFAHVTAASFLFLVGVSLVLAHGQGVRAGKFLRRLASIAAAAAAITALSWLADPSGIIVFGILHHIALASLLGLAFLRLPPAIAVAAAAFCVAAPFLLKSPTFNAPFWLWLGLATEIRASNDYVPLVPWFAAPLLGIAFARAGLRRVARDRLARWRVGNAATRMLALAGRHSLLVYLLHQPVLMALVWLAARMLA